MNPYMGDNGVFDNDTQLSNGTMIRHGFMSVMIGVWLGSLLDSTRFGRWFNTSPSVGWVYRKLAQALILGLGVFLLVYVYELIKIW
jgi:hypothetical protein